MAALVEEKSIPVSDEKQAIQGETTTTSGNVSTDEREFRSALNDLEVTDYDARATSRLLRKLDRTLLPFLALLYLLSFLDRTNIGNARLAKLEESLGMDAKTGTMYSTAVCVFFPFYVAAEIPSNLMMKRFRPSIWIPSIMVAWGLCCALMGIVHNYAGLLATRMALGVAEGGLFPGITYYITMWYRRQECGLRMAIFFSAATAAGAFGGLLARAIMEMDGVGGRAGWAWIFILEGIITIIIAGIAYFVMYDYPDTAKFLTEGERKEILRRLEHDRSVLADEFDLKYMFHAFKDWKIYVHMLITIGIYTPLYSIAVFTPTIVKELGYTNAKAQLMTVPPYVVACVFCIGGGYAADRHGQRGIYMIGFCVMAIVGWIINVSTVNPQARYFACFLVASGIYPNVPQGVAWNGNNIGGSVKRGVGIAMHVGFGNFGGAIAAWVYRNQANHFIQGHSILLATTSMSCLLCCFMHWWLRRENARRDREYKKPEEYTREEMVAEREKGDNATFFRYVI